ncbi:MAG: hypothetical protein AMJ62_03645 [Myxococcales bacterium SG8_38]|nr:MAG: hypothetical protein AMJ62_03645 [Myxococcales bacterium SG8_38]
MVEAHRRIERFRWAIALSPAVAALILGALWLAGVPKRRPDLRFSAPVAARPGTTVGLRAWQVIDDDRGQTAIVAPRVEVELRNEGGLTLASTTLTESRVQGSEGSLAIPDGLDAVLTLAALAEIDGQAVTVERALYVQEGIESRAPKGRAVNAFQMYELGPLRASGERDPKTILDPRIEEGACVPELRCWLSVWVGRRAGRARIVPRAGLRSEPGTAIVRHGFARFPLVVAGSEALVEVELLEEEGSLVAAREVRLPVVPGGLVARASATEGRVRVEWQQLGDPTSILIDVFDGGRWIDALSLDPADPVFVAPGPGVWRVQARTDLFSDNTAAVAHVVVPSSRGGADPQRLAAEAVLKEADREGLDPLALAILEGEVRAEASQDAVRALFAVPSFDVVSTGSGTSARIGDDEAFQSAQERRRWLAASAILLIGLVVSAVLLRLELLSQAHARRLLDALDEGAEASMQRGPPGRGLWAFVLLVFVLIAVLALSKRWF